MITLLGAAVLIQAAQPVRIPDEPSCARCTITSRDVATLVQPANDYARPMRIAQDPRRRYWVTREQAVPMMFDSSGRVLPTIGRKGKGPGEYEWVDQVIFAGDTTIVFDGGNARASILGPGLQVARYVGSRAQLMSPWAVAWPSVLASASEYSGDTLPMLRQMSFAGEQAALTRAFGPRNAGPRARESCGSLQLTRPISGLVLGGHRELRVYDLDEYRLDGTRGRSIERRPAWFDRTTMVYGVGGPAKAPEFKVMGLDASSEGVLWVFLYRPLPTWKDGWAKVARTGEARAASIEYDKIMALRIEVIDLVAGRIIARQDFSGFPRGVLPGARVTFVESGADGDERIVIREFRLTGR